ncbi:MAG TPA: hypothetical protein VH062_04140 [Polyangiaceae bacterium]|nr:hypothetical protein [Polyangiaceae bacterium]
MKRFCIAFATLLSACGPSYGGQDVKTPDQLVDEQDQIEQADEKNKKARGVDDANVGSEETDAEKKREFDRKQVDLELKRATRSAESCPGVVAEQETKDHPRGDTRVSITFQEDGTVRQVSIPSPFDGTAIGDCVVRAYKAVIVPPYNGGDQIIDWDVSLKDEAKAAGAKTKGKSKKKAAAAAAPTPDSQ